MTGNVSSIEHYIIMTLSSSVSLSVASGFDNSTLRNKALCIQFSTTLFEKPPIRLGSHLFLFSQVYCSLASSNTCNVCTNTLKLDRLGANLAAANRRRKSSQRGKIRIQSGDQQSKTVRPPIRRFKLYTILAHTQTHTHTHTLLAPSGSKFDCCFLVSQSPSLVRRFGRPLQTKRDRQELQLGMDRRGQ